MRAADKGTGLRLSRRDVHRLAGDYAIMTRGLLDGECFDRGHDPTKNCAECEHEVIG